VLLILYSQEKSKSRQNLGSPLSVDPTDLWANPARGQIPLTPAEYALEALSASRVGRSPRFFACGLFFGICQMQQDVSAQEKSPRKAFRKSPHKEVK
jgi:hypothetical protein